MVNDWGLPYVIPDSMPPDGEESDEQSHAYRKGYGGSDHGRGGSPGPPQGPRAARLSGRGEPEGDSQRRHACARSVTQLPE